MSAFFPYNKLLLNPPQSYLFLEQAIFLNFEKKHFKKTVFRDWRHFLQVLFYPKIAFFHFYPTIQQKTIK